MRLTTETEIVDKSAPRIGKAVGLREIEDSDEAAAATRLATAGSTHDWLRS